MVMELFQWKAEYDIGLPDIDAQHQTMVDMLNQLYTAKKTDQVHQVIEETLDRLLQYTRVHFADEEAAMNDVDYPYLSKQRREHLDMTDEVLKMRNRFMQGDEPATFELLNFMSEWLKKHITGSDRKFGEFMRKQQIATMLTDNRASPQP
jgi:hemerythrin